MLKKATTLLLPVLLTLTLTACGGSSDGGTSAKASKPDTRVDETYGYKFDGQGANVNESQFGDDWPLTVKSGRVNCVRVADTGGVEVVFSADNGKRYALNGTAKTAADEMGYLNVDKIWVDNPEIEGTKKDIGVLIDVCRTLL